jgi:tetratricopeptide (TPR) repeat protein
MRFAKSRNARVARTNRVANRFSSIAIPAVKDNVPTALLALAASVSFFFTSPLSVAASDEVPKGSWAELQKQGTEALDTGRYGDAERLLKQSVITGAGFGENDLRFAKSLGELGRLLSVRGRFAEAEPLLEESLHVKELAIGEDNPDIIPDMASMINFYLSHGTASKADPVAEKILEMVEGKIREHSTQAAGVVKYKPGQPLTAWAGQAAQNMTDPLIEWAIACDSIGDAYRVKKKFDLADRLYKAALDVKTTVLGKQHLSLANSYDSLGTLCLDRNEDEMAEGYFRDAYDMTAKILPSSNGKVFYRLDKLGKCLIKEHKYDQAEQLFLKAQDFWKEQPVTASRRGNEARALYSLGSLYVEEKKYDAAAPVLQQALQSAEAYYGGASIALVPYLQRYADALNYLGQPNETNQLRSRASTIAGAANTSTQ